MTHSDYIWIAIRIFGIYLVIQVVFSLVRLVSSVAVLIAMLPLDDVRTTFTIGQISSSLVAVLIYALFARYFLTDGRRVYSWVDLRLPTEFKGASTS